MPQLKASPNKDRVWFTGDRVEGIDAKVTDWANHVVESHEVSSPEHSEQEGAEQGPDKTLDSLLG